MDLIDATAWTPLALLLRPQGRKGEMLADLLFDQPERFTTHPTVFLAAPGFTGLASAAQQAHISNFWLPSGRNQGRIVLQFVGVETISQAECLSGLEVLIPKSDRLPLKDGAEYVEDLIGCTVFDGESQIGTLESLEFSTGPEGKKLADVAPLLTVVTRGGDEVLIPYVHAFIRSIDTLTRQIHMTLPPGLVDLNLPTTARSEPSEEAQ